MVAPMRGSLEHYNALHCITVTLQFILNQQREAQSGANEGLKCGKEIADVTSIFSCDCAIAHAFAKCDDVPAWMLYCT
jgi:hypothetical protein